MKKLPFLAFFLFSGAIAYNSSVFAEPSKEPNQAFTKVQSEEIKKIVRDYLISTPEVLVEASRALQEKQVQKAQVEAEKGIKENFKKIIENTGTPVVGNPHGEVVLVEFVDYQCGHCKTMSLVVDELAKKNKDLKVVIKELPIFGESSNYAAKAVLASFKQGKDKFEKFHQALFHSKARLSNKLVIELAKASGLDVNKLNQDMKDPLIEQELKDNIKLAQELKLAGTPAFVIANKDGSEVAFIPGAMPNPEKEFQKLIDKARKGKK